MALMFFFACSSSNSIHLLDGLVAVNLVTVLVVVLLGWEVPLLKEVDPPILEDNFLALDAVGFIKLEVELEAEEGVVRLALEGLAGVNVAEDVILIGLERILGVE